MQNDKMQAKQNRKIRSDRQTKTGHRKPEYLNESHSIQKHYSDTVKIKNKPRGHETIYWNYKHEYAPKI